MSRVRFWVLVALVAAVSVAVADSAAASEGSEHASAVVGHLYVNDNTAPLNTVAGFARHADGTLTSLPGSPFAVGGA
ncbi:MAG TPA: hypothetical protein VGU02_10455, partial [Gaiellaceae bacterium]|nr:hypothetical protein [Gaiellaceae bacterium]